MLDKALRLDYSPMNGQGLWGMTSKARQAEEAAAAHMRTLGFVDAAVTGDGPDEGIDIRSHGAIAQVKLWFRPVGAPELRQLYGARGIDHHLRMLFYAHSGYAKPAVQYADQHSIALFTFDTNGNVTAYNTSAQTLVMQQNRPATPARAKRSPARPAPTKRPIASGRSVASILAEETAAAARPKPHPRPQQPTLILPTAKSSTAVTSPATTVSGIPIQIRAEYARTVEHMRFLQIGGGFDYRIRSSDVAIYSSTAVVWLITSRRLQVQDIHQLRELSAAQDKWGVCFTNQPIPAITLNEARHAGIALFRHFKDGSIDPESPHARTLVDAARRAHPLPPIPSHPQSDGRGDKAESATLLSDEDASVPSSSGNRGLYQNKFFQRLPQA
ncbi:restriction endonuclease [Rhodococcus sp. CX]|uniref:restriction endonuclease n=1 Tax=Rhodococcus sp. CX TaxID=2789880 RepID=UPI0018CF094B|nr:restriction endonuclease [Rhodococcus sp. CX]MBH0118625.1 restriction endonuclease [Rhodococcus sp. CX]